MISREGVTKEDDRTRDCPLVREENQRQEEKTTLKTLLRTSPLFGTRLAPLPAISFCLSARFMSVWFGLVVVVMRYVSASWNCRHDSNIGSVVTIYSDRVKILNTRWLVLIFLLFMQIHLWFWKFVYILG